MNFDINSVLRREGPVVGKPENQMPLGQIPKLYLAQVHLWNGCAPDGSYWGPPPKGEKLYCAYDRAHTTRMYAWAVDRQQAQAKLHRLYPTLRFWRSR